jgi:4-amino-4-deoxy-L-arabinose transferase-like glycosyltransferase
MDTITCFLVFLIVRNINLSYWPAFIAAVLYCFSFYNIFYTRTLLSESLTTFLVTLYLLFTVIALKIQKAQWWFLSGIIFGVVVLSRVEYVLFLPVVCSYLLFLNRRAFLKKATCLLLGAAIIIAPWTVRNYAVFKKFILVSTGSLGTILYAGTFEGNHPLNGWLGFPEEVFRSKQERKQVEYYYQLYHIHSRLGHIKIKQADDFFISLALKRIRESPLRCFKAWIRNLPRLWYQNYIPMYGEEEASGAFFIFYFLFAAFSFWVSKTYERILFGPIGLMFIYLNLIYLPLHIEPRYSVCIMPGIICLAGLGIWKLLDKIWQTCL